MDRLEDHEAFLRAIYDAPDDDTPRLVYADFLEEAGDPDRAALIRVQCELERVKAAGIEPDRAALEARADELIARTKTVNYRLAGYGTVYRRGFVEQGGWCIVLKAGELADPVALRERVVREYPAWFGSDSLMIDPDRALFPDEVPALLDLPFTRQVTEWHFGGHVEELPAGPQTEDAGTFGLIDMVERPAITTGGVEALARCRGARRIRTLILTHNRLSNDALRALAASPYLINLKRLDLLEGNRLRGKVWQQVIERFGQDVVG